MPQPNPPEVKMPDFPQKYTAYFQPLWDALLDAQENSDEPPVRAQNIPW